MSTDNIDGHVHKYMDILQMNIQRMCQLSNTCKAWCITLVSAMLVFVMKEQEWNALTILLLPVFLFYVLDAYYLSVEREFVVLSRAISRKVQEGTVQLSDVFVFRTAKRLKRACLVLRAMLWSWSTLPFYGTISGVLLAIIWSTRATGAQ